MQPQEKAKEMMNKFSSLANSRIEGKRCALMAVEEVMMACEYHSAINYNPVWWNEVKAEIRKL